MAAVTIHHDFGAQEKKICHCSPTFSPSIHHEVMELDARILVFLMLLQARFFTLIKKLISSSSRSTIRVVSSAYLSLLIFLLAILIPTCDSSSLIFRLMYSTYKLNKQGSHRTGKCQFFIPIPKKGNVKNVQTTTQLHSFHTLAK